MMNREKVLSSLVEFHDPPLHVDIRPSIPYPSRVLTI